MFRIQSKSKSLKLQRETVRVISASALSAVQGGTIVGAPGTVQQLTQGDGQNGCVPQLSGGAGTGRSWGAFDCEGTVLETSRINVPSLILHP
jgi:hypothetical protein